MPIVGVYPRIMSMSIYGLDVYMLFLLSGREDAFENPLTSCFPRLTLG